MKDLNKILGDAMGVTENTPKYLVIHSSDVSYLANGDQFKSINAYHRDVRGFPQSTLGFYVGYHDLFTGGRRYKCKEEWEVGAHCNQGYDGVNIYPPASGKAQSMNYQSVGLCIGFDGDIELPPAIEYGLLQKRVWELQDKYKITDDRVFFHRKFALNKTCPGTLITSKWLSDLLKRPVPIVIPPKPDTTCTAQNAEIADLKRTWYEKLLSFFFG
jgi:hypothetical protein